MRISPDRRLLWGTGAWIALAAAAVAVPPLWTVSAAAAALGVALLAVDARLLARRPPPRLARVIPERAFHGRPAQLELCVSNDSQHPVEAEVFEELPLDLADPEPCFGGVQIAAGESVRLPVALRPRRRGDRPLGRPVLLERSPLGLLRRRVLGAEGELLRVHPDTSRYLRPEALDPRRVLAALGVKPARQRGEGLEFESLRDYVPGDDPRHLDWSASARRGRPVVRLHRHERNHTVMIAVDASRLMAGRIGGRSKLDFAVDAALALTYASLASGDRVGLAVFDGTLRGYLAPRRQRRDLGEFVEVLRPVEPRLVEADFQALAATLATRQRRRALVVLLTDFVEADAAAFRAPLVALGRHHQLLLVAVRDRVYGELDAAAPSPPGRGAPGFYRRVVLDDLLREREVALAALRRQGLQTLDLPPEAITAGVLNRYLAIRHGAAA